MKKISHSTIRRLSKYFRTLTQQIEQDIKTISSVEIANINSITSAQVRKDLSFFGTFGKRGLGYNTSELRDQIGKILGLEKQWSVGLVGLGNIGKALIQYNEFKTQGFNIKAIFDVDLNKCGKDVRGIPVYNINEIGKVVSKEKLEIAIIAVPAKVAQSTIDIFMASGVKAFLNFAPTTIKVPDDVLVKNQNMSIELEALSFFLSNK